MKDHLAVLFDYERDETLSPASRNSSPSSASADRLKADKTTW